MVTGCEALPLTQSSYQCGFVTNAHIKVTQDVGASSPHTGNRCHVFECETDEDCGDAQSCVIGDNSDNKCVPSICRPDGSDFCTNGVCEVADGRPTCDCKDTGFGGLKCDKVMCNKPASASADGTWIGVDDLPRTAVTGDTVGCTSTYYTGQLTLICNSAGGEYTTADSCTRTGYFKNTHTSDQCGFEGAEGAVPVLSEKECERVARLFKLQFRAILNEGVLQGCLHYNPPKGATKGEEGIIFKAPPLNRREESYQEYDNIRRVCWKGCDESMSEEDGSDYQGCQRETVSGRACKPWPGHYVDLYDNYQPGLRNSFCRNPNGDEQGIWCFVEQGGTHFPGSTKPPNSYDYCRPLPLPVPAQPPVQQPPVQQARYFYVDSKYQDAYCANPDGTEPDSDFEEGMTAEACKQKCSNLHPGGCFGYSHSANTTPGNCRTFPEPVSTTTTFEKEHWTGCHAHTVFRWRPYSFGLR